MLKPDSTNKLDPVLNYAKRNHILERLEAKKLRRFHNAVIKKILYEGLSV